MKIAIKFKSICLFVCTLSCVPIFANDAFKNEFGNSIVIKELNIQLGTPFLWRNKVSAKDFASVYPQSLLLKNNFFGFKVSDNIYGVNAPKLAIQMCVKFRQKDRNEYRRPTLRIGFAGVNGDVFSSRLSKTNIYPYDTIISQRTGAKIALDSQEFTAYNMQYQSTNFLLDLALIYRGNELKRWSYFCGVGFAAGISVNATGVIQKEQSAYIQSPFQSNRYSTIITEQEKFNGPKNALAYAYIPLGIDFKLSRRENFFNKIHLFYEVEPSLVFIQIDGFGKFSNLQVINAIGTRITW